MKDLHFVSAYNETLDFHFNARDKQITVTIEGFCTQTFTKDMNHRKEIIDWLTPLFRQYDSQLDIIVNTKYIDSQIFRIFLEVMHSMDEKGKITIKLKKSSIVYQNMYINAFKAEGVEIIIV